ncbi:hypothetical protein VKA52_12650 [Halobacillus sp. HZG1]|nr:hypothetical protein [Halobacillus sp. HZG1]MEC3884575.1 hypothetical protein [Halobacillus sp. HZG1]
MESSNCKQAQFVELIKVIVVEGDGRGVPFKEVTQYWSKEGELLFKELHE